MEEKYKYSESYTREHRLANNTSCLKNLNELSKADGGKGLFDPDGVVLSIDEAEKRACPSNPQKTVDMAMGIAEENSEGKERNRQMLLCEFRFNYKNPGNVSMSELEGKIKHSIELLSDGMDGVRIYPKVYFLFAKHEQARSVFARRYEGSRLKDLRVVKSEEEFRRLFF